MDIKKTEKRALKLYEMLKEYRGAFKEGAASQIDEYYKLYIDPNFAAVHIAHGSEIVISIAPSAFSLRVENGKHDDFEPIAFLDGFEKVFTEKLDEVKEAKAEYDKRLIEALEAQLKDLKAKAKLNKDIAKKDKKK